jgi:hypothetical protein
VDFIRTLDVALISFIIVFKEVVSSIVYKLILITFVLLEELAIFRTYVFF